MAYRSWLEDVKRINDLGDFCHNLEWTEENEALIEAFDQKWLERITADDLPVDSYSKAFFGSRMHDSFVQSIVRTGSKMKITLHNDYAEEFVKAYFRVQGTEFQMPLLPIFLTFEDVCYSGNCIQDQDGFLHGCDIPNAPIQIEPSYANRFAADWFQDSMDRRNRCTRHICLFENQVLLSTLAC